jgi:putative ABC transport system permease protein
VRKSLQFFVARFFRRASIENDLDAELQSHLAMEVRERIERGESPQLAQEGASREFGNRELIAEVTRDMWGFVRFEHFLQDARYAVRTLRKSPLLTTTVALTLALGIGSTTAIFTLMHGILLRPLPFPSPDRLVMIWELPPQTKKPNVVAMNNFIAWREQTHTFQSMAALFHVPMNLLAPQESEQVPGLKVTAEFFAVLGVPPILGRTFRRGEYDRDEPREVVLSYATWQRRFGGSLDIIGKRISIDVSHHEIIGVMPPGCGFPNVKADLYVPLAIDLNEGRNYSVVGRLLDGVSLGTAKAEIATVAARTAQQNVSLNAGWSATVVPLLDQAVGGIRPVLVVLFAAVALILLLACANIANLLLMRAAGRTQEISLRLALGAGRPRIVRQLLVESLVLATVGGFAGIGLSAGSVHLIRTYLPESLQIPRLNEVTMDMAVLTFAVCATILSSVIFGLAPALQSMKRDLTRDLHAATRSVTSGRKLRKTLVIVEVALAFVLVAAAGLMVRSFLRLARVDAGFHPEHVLTVRMLLLPVRDEAFHAEFVRDMLQRIRSLPGVIAAGSIGILPMQGTNSGTWYYRADRPEPAPNRRPGGDVSIITPGYFRALGIAILRGRDFNEYDRKSSSQVAILNQTAAKMLFPNEDPLGKRVRVWWNRSPIVEVVAVAADIRHSQLNSAPDPCLFMPNDQQPFPFSSLVVRASGDAAKLATAVRQQIRQVDPDQGVAGVETMQQLVVDSIARPRFETLLLCAFAFIALALACIGIYGVVAYSVTQRSREIGIRIALGASRFSVFRIVLRDGFGMTIFGLVASIASALVLTRFLRSLLFEVQPDDPITLAAVTAALAGVSLLACYFPARRAMSVDPAITLREE